jgi:hypothetical protein
MKKTEILGSLLFLVSLCLAGKLHSQVKNDPGFQVVSEDGAWCWFADPRAVYHKGAKERIYYGYINTEGDVLISARDVKTKEVETFVLHEKLQVDDHNVPSILFLPDGKIVVFYTEHGGRFFTRKSRYAENISEWDEERVLSFGLPEKRLCYSHPAMLSEENDRIYMFFRGVMPGESYAGWGQYYSYSDDQGETWADGAYLINTRNFDNPVYLKASSDNKSRIDILFTDGHPKIGPASVYHMYYEKGAFHKTNGDPIASTGGIPIGPEQATKVYDVSTNKTKSWIWDIALDKKGRPVVAYTRYPDETDHRYHYAQWDGKQWLDEEVTAAGGMITVLQPGEEVEEGHYSGGIVLDHNDPSNVYLARQVKGIFEIEHWKRIGKTWKTTPITINSVESNLRPYVVAHYPGQNPIVLWMNGFYNHYTKFKTVLLINEARSNK